MTTKERLHRLVDKLGEADLEDAERALYQVRARQTAPSAARSAL